METFQPQDRTVLCWLGMAGFLVSSRGTTILIDPLVGRFDMPVLIDFPLAPVTTGFHSTRYVDTLMRAEGFPSYGHDIGDRFSVGPVQVTVTPADHAWQNDSSGASDRVFQREDCCAFWITTPDGTVWAPGDSRLIPEHHLTMPEPDALLFDFSDSEWHFGLGGAVTMANAYPRTPLPLQHWGCVDAPDFAPFNADPASLPERVVNPGRIVVLAPGEPYTLSPLG